MGIDVEAKLVYGVVIQHEDIKTENEEYYFALEDAVIESGDDFSYVTCGYYETTERSILYDTNHCFSVEWDEVYLLKDDDLEATVDVIKLCNIARDLGCMKPRPGWYLIANYG